MRLIGATAVLVLIVLAGSSPGSSDTTRYIHLSNTKTDTGVSGTTGPITKRMGGAGDWGMNGISWSEQSDQPCHFERLIRNFNTLVESSNYWNGCEGGHWGNTKDVKFLTGGAAVVGGNYVRGIQICDNGKSSHRLKGIKVWMATVYSDRVLSTADTLTDKHTNCKTWKKAVYCPAGTIASGFILKAELQSNLGNKAKAVQGMALECRTVLFD